MKNDARKPLARRARGFTFVELMTALIIFALIATAGTYLLAAASSSQQYVQAGATTDSEIDFTVQRITENIRAATSVTLTASSLTLISPPSTLISGGTFTITYSLSGSDLTEKYVNNSTGLTYSSGVVVHNVSQFTPANYGVGTKAFQITLNAGTTTSIQRVFVAFGRNL